MPASKRIATVDPIMGTPGEIVVTTESCRAGMRVVPAGTQSHIYGTSGDMIKILFRNQYCWVPRSAVKPVESPVPEKKEPKEPRERAPIMKVKDFRVGDKVIYSGSNCRIESFPTRNSACIVNEDPKDGEVSTAKVSILELVKKPKAKSKPAEKKEAAIPPSVE